MIDVMKQALEALDTCHWDYDSEEESYKTFDEDLVNDASEALRQAIEQAEKQEPVTHAVIAGVLFDFMGWLTSRQKRLVLSSCDDASPAVKVIDEFAKMRGLSLDDAKVKDWQSMTAPPKREWVGLTDEEMQYIKSQWLSGEYSFDGYFEAIEAKLKERNT